VVLEDHLAQKPVNIPFKLLVLLEKVVLFLLISHPGFRRELDFRVTSSIVEQHFKQRGILFKSSNMGFGRQPTHLLKDFFNRSTTQAGKRGLRLWAQQALKDA
jgi:hypothetical protein